MGHNVNNLRAVSEYIASIILSIWHARMGILITDIAWLSDHLSLLGESL